MRPDAFWPSLIIAGVVLALCLIVFDITVTWSAGWVGLFLIVAAVAYRPRPWSFEDEPKDDVRKP